MNTSVRLSWAEILSIAFGRLAFLGAFFAFTFASLAADALTLTAVHSRKVHGSAGPTFDMPIDSTQSIGGALTVEPRMIGAGHQIVFQFDGPISAAGIATATDENGLAVGTATAATDVAAANDVVVTLAGIPDIKFITISLVNVNGSVSPPPVSLGFMVGDVNNTRSVNSSDISGVKARSGQTTTALNFKFDVNLTGTVNSSDISAIKARSGQTLPVATTASTQIAAARTAADGAVTIALVNALVTYVKPLIGADPAGFFVQSQLPGPALFIAVDPATLAPVPVAGDRVSFTITTMATVASLRQAASISGFSRLSAGNAFAGLVQDVSGAADLASGIDSYESELMRVVGTISGAFQASGSGYLAAPFNTAGVTGSLQLRVPSTLVASLSLAQGCQVTLNQVPMWRSNATAQVSGWVAGDLTTVSCVPGNTTPPPDPATVATPIDPTVATNIATATSFLYTGANPIQTGVTPGTIDARRTAVLRGRVAARDGTALPAVRISVLNHPEFGQTLTRADGAFDIAVNGGGQFTLRYEKNGLLPVQRAIVPRWRDYAWLPDVVMIPFDTAVTAIDLSGATSMQVARGSPVTDTDGMRQATILFPPGTTATMVLPNGTTQPLTNLNVRATEYTVGASGPKAMPAQLPPSSGYTYAAELSVDEAVDAGAIEVRFSQALPVYVENFLGFPVGTAVPTGYYDRQKGQWIASANGRVIKVLSVTNNLADLDIDGTGIAADAAALTALGVTDQERARLAQLYNLGQTLWRVPIAHFSPWDCNWPIFPPSNAISPPGQRPDGRPLNDTSEECGSIIGCENQTLGESLSVTGTPWRLHYKSDSAPGRKDARTLNIPVSGATLPASLLGMRVEVSIGARRYQATFAPAPNLTYTVTWDGKDGYGRPLQGAQSATVQVHYDYVPVYLLVPSAFQASFGRAEAAGSVVSVSRGASMITLSQIWTENVGIIDARAFGLGGWSLSVQHMYDSASRTLLLGTGRKRRAEPLDLVITTVAGTGSFGISDDGRQATATRIAPDDVAVGPDGSLYIADATESRIRRVGSSGIVTTVAGNGVQGFSGDGGPATAAQLNNPNRISVGRDGSLYIVDRYNYRLRRVGPDGIITTVAGTGAFGFSGDGGSATAARITPNDVAVGPDGSLYFPDTDFVPSSNNHRIRRVGPDGIITTVAGPGVRGFIGDGGLATAAQIIIPLSVDVGPDGSLYITDANGSRIRRVEPNGIITTVAGNGRPSFSGDGGPATAAEIKTATAAVVGPNGSLYIADFSNYRIRRVMSALPGFSITDVLLPSEDGREVYIFSASGRHLRTLDALSGALRYQFGYDSQGYLTSVTDGNGNVTRIERTGAVPTAIVAPGTQRNALNVVADGWLIGATNPANEAHTMGYSADGLLQTFTDPRGNIHRYTYDALGRLIKDENPVGGSITLNRTEQSNGYTVTTTSALGRNRAYQVEQLPTGGSRRSVTQQSGARTVTLINTDGSTQTTNPDASVTTFQYGPDPRWGMLAPRLVKRVRTLPGGQTETTTSTRGLTLADPNNLLSLQSLNDAVTVNGRLFTRDFDAATRTMTNTSGEGRVTVSVLDNQGRVIRHEPAPGVAPITVTYDAQGRVTENRQATQSWTYSYDARNRVAARTDAAGRSVSYLYDNADRIVQKTLPSGAAYQFTYDANGNRTAVILPSGASHALGYSPIDLDTSYTPPGNGSYLRTYNVDRQLTRTTLPAGRFTDQGYDTLGRVNGLSYAEAVTGFEYLASDLTDRVARITNTPVLGPAQDVAYSYNGSLISGMTASGAAPAQVSYTFDNNFFPTSMSLVSGAETVASALSWDNDGLVKGFGPFTFVRNGPGGALSQISDATAITGYTYDALARIATRSHQVSAPATYAMQLSYDTTGRVTGRTETLSGITYTYAYTYDLNGQLTEVRRGGVLVESYTYDLNGNRTSRQLGSGAVEAASYDSQDRLIQRGAVAYQFNADGFLTQRGADAFQYSSRGQLLGATVGGQPITYAYDGLGRRVSRTDGGGTHRYLYGDPASHLVTAVRAPSGALTALFYDTAGLLIALERAGARYYVATDQVGTPRVVSDSTGTLVKVVETDSFGNVTTDSNQTFDLPIGYAGGLADAATGFVHFSFRDYDSAAGRWTARDPVLFGGGQGNLYVYARNSPIAHRDPSGLFCISVTLYGGVGGGVQTCITSEGASVCGEVGFGVGGGAGVDNGDLEESGTEIGLEAAVKCGPLTLGGKVGLDSKGCLNFGLKGAVDEGPVSADSGGGVALNFEAATPDVKLSTKCAAQGKLYGKICTQGKF